MIRAIPRSNDPLTTVRDALAAYAERGVFRGFHEREQRRGVSTFTFVWLNNRPMGLVVDTKKHILRFKELLPGVAARSSFCAELRSFVVGRQESELPAHRRIDRRRAVVSCTSRGGSLSVVLEVKGNQYAYGVNRIVNLVHELFVHLRDTCPEYLAEHFDVPLE